MLARWCPSFFTSASSLCWWRASCPRWLASLTQCFCAASGTLSPRSPLSGSVNRQGKNKSRGKREWQMSTLIRKQHHRFPKCHINSRILSRFTLHWLCVCVCHIKFSLRENTFPSATTIIIIFTLFHQLKTNPAVLTISEAVVLAVISQVFWGGQEVFLYGRDGAIGVIIEALSSRFALLTLSLFSPLQADQELVDLKDDATRLCGASLPRTLKQAHTCASLPALNAARTNFMYTHTYSIYIVSKGLKVLKNLLQTQHIGKHS